MERQGSETRRKKSSQAKWNGKALRSTKSAIRDQLRHHHSMDPAQLQQVLIGIRRVQQVPRQHQSYSAGQSKSTKSAIRDQLRHHHSMDPAQLQQVLIGIRRVQQVPRQHQSYSAGQSLFAETRSLFVRRFECFKIRQQSSQDITSLIAHINASCKRTNLSLTKEQLKCMILVIALRDEHHDLRQKCLKMLEEAEKNGTNLTLQKLEEELRAIQLVKDSALSLFPIKCQEENQIEVTRHTHAAHAEALITGDRTANSEMPCATSARNKGTPHQPATVDRPHLQITKTDNSTRCFDKPPKTLTAYVSSAARHSAHIT
uniref:Uncharacterized protein n=1 Tax=Globodera pallida TaxID=36090 RepID=A0A183CNT7_GLOPA